MIRLTRPPLSRGRLVLIRTALLRAAAFGLRWSSFEYGFLPVPLAALVRLTGTRFLVRTGLRAERDRGRRPSATAAAAAFEGSDSGIGAAGITLSTIAGSIGSLATATMASVAQNPRLQWQLQA
ncbi:hypothetical protein D3H35_28100 [Cohnella faecalis]|uniref:Uncharacterized protein n=1 Tax=Cohnella faecalis TaxID=2315694 RepID=A0A398CHZ5_9BACL|nr:hypothetical protein D3H35_28100 [Cohnella faecalis]